MTITLLFTLTGLALFSAQIAVTEFRAFWHAHSASYAPVLTFPPYRHSDASMAALIAHYRKP